MIIKIQPDAMFFVSTVRNFEELDGFLYPNDTQCTGFFHDYEVAEKFIADCSEMWRFKSIRYAVIEMLRPGNRPESKPSSRQFFKYDDKKGIFAPIDEPKELGYLSNFALS